MKCRIAVIEADVTGEGDVNALFQSFGRLLAGAVVQSVEPSPEQAPRAQPAPRERDAQRGSKPAVARALIAEQAQPAQADAPVPELQGKKSGIAATVLEAFRRQNDIKLTDLARDIYGDASGASLTKLKQIVYYLEGQGRLKRTGAASYAPV